jgi:sulfur relay (sulfurtransferase) DsrC/TusE family protein
MKVKTEIKAGPDFVVGDKTLEIDEDGFIQDPSVWSDEVALAL